MILTTSFYDMNQKIKTKKLVSKILVDSEFVFKLHCMYDYLLP